MKKGDNTCAGNCVITGDFMIYIITLLIGAINSIMILFNGTLSSSYGNLSSSIIIHIVGLIGIILVLLITKTSFKLRRDIPLYLYSAGFIGIGTVLLTNISYANLGVSLHLALSLFGQTISSLLIDHFGLFGMKVTTFNKKKSIGLFLIVLGICIMTVYK